MKKISKIGIVALVLLVATTLVSASLLTYFGQVTTTANVEQAVVISADGNAPWNSYNTPITHTIPEPAPGGETFCVEQWIWNKASIPVAVSLDTNAYEVITTSYSITVVYSFTNSQAVNDGTVGQLVTTVAEDGDWMVWTFDFPVEQFTGDGNLNVGLIIATDGDGNGPAYQIHNDDGADPAFADGTWLYSPWGPTIGDGWFGWHSGDTNTLVTSLSWVEATGDRVQTGGSGDGILQVKILKSVLGESFHWAASPTVGSGFFAPAYDVTMQIPTGFNWGTPLVTMGTPNYIEANLWQPTTGFTLLSHQQLLFRICYAFDLHIAPGTYILTTTVDANEIV